MAGLFETIGGVFMDNRTFGYARVSSREQHEDRQIEALTNYGVSRDNIIVDKCSGKDTEREGYQYLKKQILRSGDTLVSCIMAAMYLSTPLSTSPCLNAPPPPMISSIMAMILMEEVSVSLI